MSKEENHLIEERRKKLAELKKLENAFPNDFRRKNLAQDLKNSFDNLSKEEEKSFRCRAHYVETDDG